ncbi:MAG: 23S rRNA (guanosine(2251)-2'-O)-methyltransferase RlmB [Oscillospiraceae bacterium]|nr:23S rRNA (guanosine(2251)-2'-O)-methyltransferase RlmB [Oscillospiraceae bacterium]
MYEKNENDVKEYKIEGRNPVAEAIRSGREIDKIFIKKGNLEGSIIPIIKKAKEKGIVISEVEGRKLDSMSETGSHQGIIAYVAAVGYCTIDEILKTAEEKNEPPFVIICDKISDPRNLGSVIRTANCAGVHGIIIPKRGGAGLGAAAAKAAAGAEEYTKLCKVTNIARTVDELKEKGLWIAGADFGGTPMYSADLTGALGIVIGSEGFGISRLVREKCDFSVTIPMFGEISSLNASVAAALLMYEAVRQRRPDIYIK